MATITSARILVLILTVFILPSNPRQTRAQPLVEYLFWDSLGKTVGKGAQAYVDYRAERQLWQAKIAAAKAELERCGDCSSAQSELDKWQGIENDFQNVAGGLAQSVGMPPVIANWLGISLPMAPSRPPGFYEKQRKRQIANLVPQPWVASRPDYCRVTVGDHLNCLKGYLSQAGAMQSLSSANFPGGRCYDTGKLYKLCQLEDYEGFSREVSVQKARASGAVIPEYLKSGVSAGVYYGSVPDDFMPIFPPPEIVRKELAQQNTREVKFIMYKKAQGKLGGFSVQKFFRFDALPESKCADYGFQPTETEKRECSDINKLNVSTNNEILFCLYTRFGGTATFEHDYKVFWYENRPKLADPTYLIERSANHPVLKIGDPRIACPATKAGADNIETKYFASLGDLRAQIPQIPETENLPTDAEIRARETLAAFPIEGKYTAKILKGYKELRKSSCLIKENWSRDNFGTVFTFNCQDRQGTYGGTMAAKDGELTFAAGGGFSTVLLPSFPAAVPTLSGTDGRYTVILSRDGNLR